FALGKDVDVVVAPTEQIDNRIKEYYGADTTSMEQVLKQLGEAGDMLQIRGDETAAAVEAEANATPIIRFVDLILYQAIQDRASVVLRVLDRSTVNLDLEMLGMPDYVHNYILEIINRPNGIFIATGPTGSGKTTTLYSCLRKINTIDAKLLTAEEPVEYDLEG